MVPKQAKDYDRTWHAVYEVLPIEATTVGQRQEIAKAIVEMFRPKDAR